jgi:hypothetical protein
MLPRIAGKWGRQPRVSPFIATPGGRLTLATATPVMTTTQSAQTTVFYTPYQHQFVPLYNGSTLAMVDIGGELSQATTDTTKSPAAVAANSNYDVFIWSDSGTIRATRGPAWTSGTARGSGAGTTELVRVRGVLLNANAITNGPDAQRGTYVGSIRSNGSSQIDWILGGAASGGVAAVLGVWNAHNRTLVGTSVRDTGVAYTYTLATVRQARASAGNQISFIVGLQEDSVWLSYLGWVKTVAAGSTNGAFGIGLDSTTTYAFQRAFTWAPTAAVSNSSSMVSGQLEPLLGFHTVSANEAGDGVQANTFNSDTNNSLHAQLRM